MTLPTITIRGIQYPEPSIDRMKRKQVKAMRPLVARMQDEDLDSLWDIVALVIPALPADTVDDLELGECKAILEKSGLAKFSNEPQSEEITAGESSASTNS